ncbi:PEP-CTERM sorting domain-containing protein [Denitromonas sp.]|uniref:PEP-CTERM sorting domain-containing protein n=1 Tax=Denitromonas sp. TaxID=2734609 RepID=UPI002AFE5513|nr:PEP-CTERM sorting domain-containing protein [Denitromonas sp.]
MPANRLSLLTALTALAALTPSAHASNGWYLNAAGTGWSDASFVSSLNVAGAGFIEQAFSLPALGLAFEEHGAYQIAQSSTSPSHDLTVSYNVTGAVGLLGSGFTGGVIDLYSDAVFDFGSTNGFYGANNGTRIASFAVTGGQIDPISRLVGLQANLVSGSLASGYFFDVAGNDLSGRDGISLSLGVQSTIINPAGTHIVQELACEQAGFTGPGCNGRPYRPSFLNLAWSTVYDSGVATLNIPALTQPVTAVPEPTTALMMLTGLLGLAARQRFKKG